MLMSHGCCVYVITTQVLIRRKGELQETVLCKIDLLVLTCLPCWKHWGSFHLFKCYAQQQWKVSDCWWVLSGQYRRKHCLYSYLWCSSLPQPVSCTSRGSFFLSLHWVRGCLQQYIHIHTYKTHISFTLEHTVSSESEFLWKLWRSSFIWGHSQMFLHVDNDWLKSWSQINRFKIQTFKLMKW